MKKLFFVFLMIALGITTSTCKNNDGADGKGSFANILDVWDGFAGAEGGAIPIVSLVVLNYRNESSKTEKAIIKVDWPDDIHSSKEIDIPPTPSDLPPGMAITDEVDCDIWCPKAFLFKDEISITVNVHVEFLGYISPIFEKIITMKNYSG